MGRCRRYARVKGQRWGLPSRRIVTGRPCVHGERNQYSADFWERQQMQGQGYRGLQGLGSATSQFLVGDGELDPVVYTRACASSVSVATVTETVPMRFSPGPKADSGRGVDSSVDSRCPFS